MASSRADSDKQTLKKAGSNWNVPNALTFSRVLMAPVIAFLLSDDDSTRNTLAAAVMGTAAFTDFLDGHLARKQGKETRLGQFMDPLADKVCISTAFVMLAARRRLRPWVPGVIMGREAMMTLFRLYAGSRGSSVPASIWGKLKTNSQLLAVLLVIMERDTPLYEKIERAAVNLAVFMTLYSGVDYMLKASRYLDDPEGA